MATKKKEHVIRKIEQHLRKMTRKLIKIDSEEEALQYLSDSFRAQLYCDFVGVIFVEKNKFTPKIWSGKGDAMRQAFPLDSSDCSGKLMIHSLTNEEESLVTDQCKLFSLLDQNEVKTWFTVPIYDELQSFGFCLIGFYDYVPLLEMSKHFDEFGKDVALAINLTRERNTQVKKTEGIEWITQNLSIDSPFEETIKEITTRAGKGTGAKFACIYLYNDIDDCFIFQSPSYGNMIIAEEVYVQSNLSLSEFFPYLDRVGGSQLTTIIAMDIKTIGVLHVEGKQSGEFNDEDLRILSLLSNHVATSLENARLYNSEKENHARLHFLLEYQQALVKETVKHENYDGITSMVNKLFDESIVLFDRFMRPLSYKLQKNEHTYFEELCHKAEIARQNGASYFELLEYGLLFTLWPIKSGNDLLGYLAIRQTKSELDDYDQLMIEMARNIYSIQFSKQKLVLDVTEQAKESLANKLFVKHIDDETEESILQYANLFMWDLYEPHRVVLLSIVLSDENHVGSNLLEIQMKKALVWDYIKFLVIEKRKKILATPLNDQYLLIIPGQKQADLFWKDLYEQIEHASKKSGIHCEVYLGIGSLAEQITDYYPSSEQARQALNIVKSSFYPKKYAFFEQLGSYTVLQHLNNEKVVDLYINNQLGPIMSYSNESKMNLIDTLHTYLQTNGNAKASAEKLFLHRSSLLYRLEKIEELLTANLNDPEVRFNLMLAYRLLEMRD